MAIVLRLLTTFALIALIGCGGVSMVEVNEESRLLVAEAAARDRMLALREAALKRREKELSTLETRVSDNGPSSTLEASNQLALSNSDSNGCVAALFIPAQLKQGPVEFLATQSHETATITPARFERSEQLVYVGQKPADPSISVNYKAQIEKIVIRPAHTRSHPQPASFETVATTVELKPEYLDWQPCADNEAFCATKQQAELTAIEQRVVSLPLRLNTIRVPAIIQEVEIQVPLQSEQSVTGGFVDVFKPIPVQKLKADEQILLERVPSTHTTLEAWTLTEAARVELRPVICSDELLADGAEQASGLLGRLRAGLIAAGYSVNERGGFDSKLKEALRSYQRDKGLALSDDLPSIESMSALGAYP